MMKYKTFVQQLGYPTESIEGFTTLESSAPIPQELKQYYKQVGKMPFNQSHNFLINPEQLEIVDDKLIFLSENQEVCVWGVDEYCSVFQGVAVDSGYEWYPEEVSLHDFLMQMIVFQTVMGGFSVGCILENSSDFEKLTHGMQKFKFPEMTAFSNGSIVVCSLGKASVEEVYIASRTEKQMKNFEALSNTLFTWL